MHANIALLQPSDLSGIRPTWVNKIETTHVDGVSVPGPCWLWRGAVDKVSGYGRVNVTQRPGKRINYHTHRFIYEHVQGPVPQGFELDHLCRQRACCAPHHMEPVTHLENMRRGSRASQTHCARSNHPLSGDNLYVYTDRAGKTSRYCRACRAANSRGTAA